MISDEQIRVTVARELRVPLELLQPDTVLYSLPGFDSVQLLMLMVALDEMGVKMPTADAASLRTFADILVLERV
ncbi:MAG TPA: acyl carrier protein [Opitutales bacterium]|jgi:acyl carrier protein|nr:acyl carrier protein [Opitutales bacterium]